MKIPNKIKYLVNGEIKTWDVYAYIQAYSTCEWNNSLSERFQVLKDEPNKALWRINPHIHIDGSWLGQLVLVDLEKNTISFGADMAIAGRSTNLYDMKPNCILTDTYQLV